MIKYQDWRNENEALDRVVNCPSDNFVELMNIVGLNPARDFKYLDLSYVNFENCNLNGFDFRGSRLIRAKFRNAYIHGAIFDNRQRQLPELAGALDYRSFFENTAEPQDQRSSKDWEKDFFWACVEGDAATMRKCIAAGLDIDHEFFQFYTRSALLESICQITNSDWEHEKGAHDGIIFLLRAGANVNYISKDEIISPLLQTVRFGFHALTKLLLSFGADPNQEVPGIGRPLPVAINRGNYKTAKLLIRFGADLDLVLNESRAPYGETKYFSKYMERCKILSNLIKRNKIHT